MNRRHFVTVVMLIIVFVAVEGMVSAQAISYATLGDSLTEGDGDDGIGGGYPPRLLALLLADHPGTVYTNVGVSGHTSDDLINIQLDPVVVYLNGAPAGNTKMALVWIGSNDLFGLYNYVCDYEYGNNYEACESDTFGYFSANINTILTTLNATGSELFIALLDDQSRRPVMTDPVLRADAYPDIDETDVARMSTQVSLYNSEIVSQAAALGATTVDFFNTTIFEDWATLSDDGNHPNGAGYDAVAGIWFEALTSPSSTLIFSDGFESGDSTLWSTSQP